MFSGIVEEIGTVVEVKDSADGRSLKIASTVVVSDIAIGHSVSIGGACLTVVKFDKESFVVEAVQETLRMTTVGQLKVGSKVNLERALKFSDRLGGHLVSGHVDSLGTIHSIEEEGFSRVITFMTDRKLAPYFVEKGSVAIEGVSLTVWGLCDDAINKAGDDSFGFKVALIPHTLSVTTLGQLKLGDQVNLETDVVARYVARWLEPSLMHHKLMESDLSQIEIPAAKRL